MVWYPNGQAPKSAMVFYKGCYFNPSLYRRVKWVDDTLAAQGVSFTINQGYRFLGVPADRAIGASDYSANEAKASQTSTGDGNQYYQAGRASIGMTPSAATPGQSNHGDWDIGAVDTNTNNMTARANAMAKVGMSQTISSETWHDAVTGNPTVNLDNIDPETDEDMPLNDADKAWLTQTSHDQVVNVLRAPEFDVGEMNKLIDKMAKQIENLRALPSTQAGFRDLITGQINALLGRVPTDQEYANYLNQLNDGTEADLIAAIKDTDEYKRLHP